VNEKIKYFIFGLIFGLLICLAGAGFIWYRQGLRPTGELDNRFSEEYGGATEIVRGLEDELEREREINRQLRDYNSTARQLALGIADSTEQNVRNLQDAIGVIREIRKKYKVLADFYNNSGPDSGWSGSVGRE